MTSHDKTLAWWQARAAEIPDGLCPKCRSLTQASYAVDTSGEGEFKSVYRAIVEKCRACGWCHIHWAQAGTGPVEVNTNHRAIRPVGMNLEPDVISDDEADQIGVRLNARGRKMPANRKKVVRLKGQGLKAITKARYKSKPPQGEAKAHA
jgi:hypothetical protein